jgi:hypothetical protein
VLQNKWKSTRADRTEAEDKHLAREFDFRHGSVWPIETVGSQFEF